MELSEGNSLKTPWTSESACLFWNAWPYSMEHHTLYSIHCIVIHTPSLTICLILAPASCADTNWHRPLSISKSSNRCLHSSRFDPWTTKTFIEMSAWGPNGRTHEGLTTHATTGNAPLTGRLAIGQRQGTWQTGQMFGLRTLKQFNEICGTLLKLLY